MSPCDAGMDWREHMNVALIFAGGTGQRMSARAKPKQFLELHGKPIILYTLDHFESHPDIDQIVIVCLKSWIKELEMLLHRYDFTKVVRIVSGGATGHESIYNGLSAMEPMVAPDDIVLIHDGVRPLINEELITANIAKAKEYGSVITVEAATESVVKLDANDCIESVPHRSQMFIAKAPQSFRFGLILEYY
ncbi:MAG: 2-C-methyl-D-erythritol 4-phosphate cytidylyltransferase, partial [Clostridium sp.]|nr:2-C-methyl-D-erythritol 4-phosphate cytidylyltransferase [Clostridium sp.]